jgi:outer membrane lipoprotein carrier protein
MMKNAMKKAIPTLLMAAVAAIAAYAGGVGATDDPPACVDAAIDAIQKRYESVSDLSATFVQTTRSVALSGSGRTGAVTSRGTVVFAKPGKMRWSYEEPEPSLVVSDGKTLWIYDPAHAEVQRTSVTDGFLSGAAIEFLLGEGDIRRDFRVTALACDDGAVELSLVPRRDASYEKIRLQAGLPGGELRRTTIFDLLGNITEVEFSELRANQNPGEGVFQFEPPDGVSVIDLDVL